MKTTIILFLALAAIANTQTNLEFYQAHKLSIKEGWFSGEWQAYQGKERISTDEFCRLTGVEKPKANMAGLLFGAAGGYMAYKGFSAKQEVTIGNDIYQRDKPNYAMGITGIVLMAGGFASMAIQGDKEISYEQAREAAERFNFALLRRMNNW